MAKSVCPDRDAGDAVYSNFDHELDREVAERLQADPDLFAQHAAWNFCGYVWYRDGRWFDEVWRFRSVVALHDSDSLEDLVADVNDTWGHE